NDLTVSGDGTWQKRGYTSAFGVSSIIGYFTGKILDINIKSAYCKLCEYWKKKRSTVEFEEWYESHEDECSANHKGSSGKMEVDAMIEMFQQSETKHGVRYANYIGDASGELDTYTQDYSPLPPDVLKAIKPIYDDLSNDNLLSRCVGGFNQNNNESFNQLVWKICPKTMNTSFTIVQIAAYIATCIFNEGTNSLLMIMNAID
ncbi:GSCOCG00012915001-RA-CDS, partial [Cotesia congregata]